MHERNGGEIAKFRDSVQSTKHVNFVMWSEPSRHYTYSYVRSLEGQPRHIKFKDGSHGEVARTVATWILRNLRLIEPHAEARSRAPRSTRKTAGVAFSGRAAGSSGSSGR